MGALPSLTLTSAGPEICSRRISPATPLDMAVLCQGGPNRQPLAPRSFELMSLVVGVF